MPGFTRQKNLDLPTEERLARRRKEVWGLAYEQDLPSIASEKTRGDLQYSMNHERYLKVLLENGEVPINNSATERAIRHFTIARSNWHIIDIV